LLRQPIKNSTKRKIPKTIDKDMSTIDKLGNIAELKRQALEYYAANSEITKKVEDALNDLFYTEPEDVYGYLVRPQ
jgi:hypothetical protein